MVKRVALDGMIRRADFAEQDNDTTLELFEKIHISQLNSNDQISKILRKPDFQRETNHWSPAQVATFISSFANGELIPSLILWKSNSYIFVIDGAHRLSALKAWVDDDFGDGWISNKFFSGEISEEQKKLAKQTRRLVESSVGKFADFSKIDFDDSSTPKEIKKLASTVASRGISIQWIKGNPEVAESSFFKINTQGTPLDKTEELLLRNRNKSYAIGARSIVRSGTGHKYWSKFDAESQKFIEKVSQSLFQLLFQPDLNQPIKTLDLPLGGTSSPLDALKMLIDIFAIVDGYSEPAKAIAEQVDDATGEDTLQILKKTQKVVTRLTGNSAASLGLHPAVYFYNERGRHSRFFFLGTIKVIATEIANNNKQFFKEFSTVRGDLEKILVQKKSVINQGLSNVNSRQRIDRMAALIRGLFLDLKTKSNISDSTILQHLGLEGKLGKIKILDAPAGFSDDTKSAIFLQQSLKKALPCPICGGYLDASKAASYDHIQKKSDGGDGTINNGQLTHPYCNSGIKG